MHLKVLVIQLCSFVDNMTSYVNKTNSNFTKKAFKFAINRDSIAKIFLEITEQIALNKTPLSESAFTNVLRNA